MEYQFTFDRKRLLLVLAGLLFAGILTFACGLIVGIGLWMPTQKDIQPARAKAVLKAPLVAAPPPPKTPAAAASPEPVPAAVTAAAVAGSVPSSEDEPFVLQVGAFRDRKNASKMQTELKEKGYATTIFNGVDEDRKTWHMVRLGGYKDLEAAARAASDFSGKERIQALVRRSDSL